MKRRIPNRKKIERQDAWMGAVDSPKRVDGVQYNRDGTPTTIPLFRFENDRSLRGAIENYCCGCHLRHLYAFEVFKAPDGRIYLTKRAYRIEKEVPETAGK